ncbi:MAG: DUF386 domain-containing protein [Erysipelotrichia bacterium]|nr:DUF386 domain-containing protein [Erysipelotrichia bacterium]
MVIDRITNLSRYLPSRVYERMEKVLHKINKDTVDGTYNIDKDMFIKVMSYELQSEDECKLEAHNEYIDIQSTLVGVEGIGIFDRNPLTVTIPYNAEKDVIFFEREKARIKNNIVIYPQDFVLLFPEEAHSPKQKVAGYKPQVKKFVIKLRASLFRVENDD